MEGSAGVETNKERRRKNAGGTTPGPWTTIPAASIQKAITISGLTPATTYGFQVQALGVLGYSDWSAIETIICLGSRL